MQRFTLFTLNYPRFRPEMGVPVRTSNGYPRFVKYRIDYAVKEVMPDRATIKMTDREEFTRLYRTKLNNAGLDVIASRFRAIAAATGDERLVLLCYENLEQAGNWCHRNIFAAWWQDMTGEQVRELGPLGPPKPEPMLF